jgi:N-acetylglucosamine kinase-like BadF-type ATPase
VLGLDVGGTHSRARLVRQGEVVAEATAASASLTTAGRERATEAMYGLFDQLGLGPGPGLDAVCIGTAGSGAPAAAAFLVGLLSPLTAGGRVVVVNDARLVLAAADVADGIACVAGTGSIAVGLVGGREERAGGWGYLLGDEGSGYWVVREAVRELAGRHDSGVRLGALGEAVLKAARCPDVTSLVQRWHDRPSAGAWAAMAPLVLDCGEAFGVAVAERAAVALAALVCQVHSRLESPSGLPVVLSGGLLTGHRAIAAKARRRIELSLPDAQVILAREPPVVGAVKIALAAAARGDRA